MKTLKLIVGHDPADGSASRVMGDGDGNRKSGTGTTADLTTY